MSWLWLMVHPFHNFSPTIHMSTMVDTPRESALWKFTKPATCSTRMHVQADSYSQHALNWWTPVHYHHWPNNFNSKLEGPVSQHIAVPEGPTPLPLLLAILLVSPPPLYDLSLSLFHMAPVDETPLLLSTLWPEMVGWDRIGKQGIARMYLYIYFTTMKGPSGKQFGQLFSLVTQKAPIKHYNCHAAQPMAQNRPMTQGPPYGRHPWWTYPPPFLQDWVDKCDMIMRRLERCGGGRRLKSENSLWLHDPLTPLTICHWYFMDGLVMNPKKADLFACFR